MSDVRTSVGLQASREPAECAAQAPLMTTLHQSSGYPIAREGYQHLNNHNPAVIPVVKNGVDIGVRDKPIESSETPYAALIECVKLLCEQTRQPNAAALPAAVNVREAGDQAHTTVKNERSPAGSNTTECPQKSTQSTGDSAAPSEVQADNISKRLPPIETTRQENQIQSKQHNVMRPKEFDGKKSVNSYLSHFRVCTEFNK